MNRKNIVLLSLLLPGIVSAEIVLKSPDGGKVLELLPKNQKEILAIPSHAERLKILSEDKAKGKKSHYFRRGLTWGQPMTLYFRWECTANEKGPFLVMLSETPDFKAFKLFGSSYSKNCSHPGWEFLNLKLGRKYYWKVMTKDQKTVSKTASFVTDDQPPRWIRIGGKVGNMRDLGGWKTADGKRVKQGILFRGQGLNYNSLDGKKPGCNRLMIEDIELLCGELGIKTDLDLRTSGETANMKKSPLGDRVRFVHIPAPAYLAIHAENCMKTIAQEFKVIANPANTPVYFHCIGGWDRTGALAFIANGLLGVPENSLALDWELTTHPSIPDMPPKPDPWRDYVGMVKGFDKYGKAGDPLSKKIENYLLKAGVTSDEIAAFRKMMLED